VQGEHLPGVHGSPEVVGWYNSHTDVGADAVDVSTDRVVVVGNGNVALDVARILLGDAEALARTDIADHALTALREAPVREVVVVGRRGPDQAAFTRPELLMMPRGIDVVIEADGQVADEIAGAAPGSKAALLASLPLVDVDWSTPPPEGRRLVLSFHRTVDEITGADRVEGVRLGRVGSDRRVDVTSSNGRPATGEPVPGAYVVGWIKRGAYGGIGTNRTDAQQTVSTLLQDARDHRLPEPRHTASRSFARMLRSRGLDVVTRRRMKKIDALERARGVTAGRPRVKFATVDEMLEGRR
jgi:ferredoxin--NADP+ reductase